jgi:hypothetical protein
MRFIGKTDLGCGRNQNSEAMPQDTGNDGAVRIQALHQLQPGIERAVIINVGTEVVTSLAIASALHNLDMPVLVVNCTAEGASKRFMDALSDHWQFELIDWPLAEHGVTIDRLFREVHVERLTLLDSDAEIRSAELMKRVRSAFADDEVYGAGYLHTTDWLTVQQSPLAGDVAVLYAERPWIPFATFRTSYVRGALASGRSFREVHLLGMTDALVLDRAVMGNRVPALVHGDTGAEMHGWLTAQELRFDGPDVNEVGNDVRHFHGVSRFALGDGRNATPLDQIESEVLARLNSDYSPYWPGFAAAVKAAQKS